MNNKEKSYGAAVERGEIIRIENNAHIVRSLTRDGVTSLPMTAIDNKTYAAGQKVYFFMFEDGNGKILAGM